MSLVKSDISSLYHTEDSDINTKQSESENVCVVLAKNLRN